MVVVDWQSNFGLMKLMEVELAKIAVYLYLPNNPNCSCQPRDQVLGRFEKNWKVKLEIEILLEFLDIEYRCHYRYLLTCMLVHCC